MFLTSLPIFSVLILAIIFNGQAEGFAKLYPLIIAAALGIVFIFVYLLRFIVISTDEIKIIGLFTSKDRAIINKDKTLIISQRKKKRVKLILFGNDGRRPALDWANKDDFTPVDINLFKEIGYVGSATIKRIFRYFEIDEPTIDALILKEDYSVKTPLYELSKTTKDKKFEYKIKFLETI
jgi:hypothetical protein